MTSKWVRSGQWVLLFIAMAATGLLARQNTEQVNRGEQVMNASCLACHDLRPIQTQALDEEGWTKMIASMIGKGAQVGTDDVPALVSFLVRHHGPLPDGAGKAILLNKCTVCHDLDRVKFGPRDEAAWLDTLSQMLSEGAMLSDQDLAVLVNYLVRYFNR